MFDVLVTREVDVLSKNCPITLSCGCLSGQGSVISRVKVFKGLLLS